MKRIECQSTNCDKTKSFGTSDYVKLKTTGERVLIVDMDESGYSVKNRDGHIIKAKLEDLEGMETDYVIPVMWEMYGEVKVSAKNAQEALEKAERDLDHIKLPFNNSKYVEASFNIVDVDIGELYIPVI